MSDVEFVDHIDATGNKGGDLVVPVDSAVVQPAANTNEAKPPAGPVNIVNIPLTTETKDANPLASPREGVAKLLTTETIDVSLLRIPPDGVAVQLTTRDINTSTNDVGSRGKISPSNEADSKSINLMSGKIVSKDITLQSNEVADSKVTESKAFDSKSVEAISKNNLCISINPEEFADVPMTEDFDIAKSVDDSDFMVDVLADDDDDLMIDLTPPVDGGSTHTEAETSFNTETQDDVDASRSISPPPLAADDDTTANSFGAALRSVATPPPIRFGLLEEDAHSCNARAEATSLASSLIGSKNGKTDGSENATPTPADVATSFGATLPMVVERAFAAVSSENVRHRLEVMSSSDINSSSGNRWMKDDEDDSPLSPHLNLPEKVDDDDDDEEDDEDDENDIINVRKHSFWLVKTDLI